VAVPDFQSIMSPLLRLAGNEQEHTVHDAVDALGQQFKLTAEEKQNCCPVVESRGSLTASRPSRTSWLRALPNYLARR
jgi:restriction endonuclease Mrr